MHDVLIDFRTKKIRKKLTKKYKLEFAELQRLDGKLKSWK